MVSFSIQGTMARRMLVNWRVDPEAVQAVLPPGLKPNLVGGHAVVGICLVRLEHVRPIGLPAFVGLSSDNAASRIAVEWTDRQGPHHAVLIVRRDTASTLNNLICGPIGYGIHHRAPFIVDERNGRTHVRKPDAGDGNSFDIAARDTEGMPPTSVFESMEHAARFFRGAEVGYSPSARPGLWNGLRLSLSRWELTPMTVEHARSSWIDTCFPSAVFDSAFILRGVPHRWDRVDTRNWDSLADGVGCGGDNVEQVSRLLAKSAGGGNFLATELS